MPRGIYKRRRFVDPLNLTNASHRRRAILGRCIYCNDKLTEENVRKCADCRALHREKMRKLRSTVRRVDLNQVKAALFRAAQRKDEHV